MVANESSHVRPAAPTERLFASLAGGLGEAAQWRMLEMVYLDRYLLWANLVLSALIGFMAWLGLHNTLTAAWGVANVLLAAARLYESWSFVKLRRNNRLRAAQLRFFLTGCALASLWGCASFVLLLTNDPMVWFWLLNCQTGFVAFAVARNNPLAPVAYAQVILTICPLGAACLLSPHVVIKIYALVAVLFLFACFGTIRHLHGRTMRFLRADEENAALLKRENEANLRLQAVNRQLEALAATDALTGIANRLTFDIAIKRAWSRAIRSNMPLGLLLIDIDHFKRLNDRLGHQAGDTYLRAVAQCIAANAQRPGDLAARYGGEEFAVILPDADEFGIIDAGERIRTSIEALALAGAAGLPVTVSVGAALLTPPGAAGADAQDGTEQAIRDLIAAADRKLYEAKSAGRNCVRGQMESAESGCKPPPAPDLQR